MSNFYPVPPVITGEVLSSVPQDLWATKTTEWIPGMDISFCPGASAPSVNDPRLRYPASNLSRGADDGHPG